MQLALFVALVATAAGNPPAKHHVFKGETLTVAPLGAKAGWWPSARVKANDTISVTYPLDLKDMDIFECSSAGGVRLSLTPGDDGKGVRVGIRAKDPRPGPKKATAKVQWHLTKFDGTVQSGWMDVVFE